MNSKPSIRQRFARRGKEQPAPPPSAPALTPEKLASPDLLKFDVAPNDPLVAWVASSPGVLEINKIKLDSPALRALRGAGVALALPLTNQGELVALVNIGPRNSEQEFSSDNRKLLRKLAAHAAPAVRIALLLEAQRRETEERERIQQELQVAQLVQKTLLPSEIPDVPGYNLAWHYQPARAVGGDFYDFIALRDGKVALVIADVTDKGVPAALVMATTRATLRAACRDSVSPGEILGRANEYLCPDIPPKMFVTCFMAVLDTLSHTMVYANAGHDVPYMLRASDGQIGELRARGMPLGLFAGMPYEEKQLTMAEGDRILFYTDGLVEAHNRSRDMLGFGEVQNLIRAHGAGSGLIERLLAAQAEFTGPGWEQEDDTTLIVLERVAPQVIHEDRAMKADDWSRLAAFETTSEPGNEREVMRQVAGVIGELLPAKQLERLKTAVAEATMNAIEHGNNNRPELMVGVEVARSASQIAVRISDHGGGPAVPEPAVPDLDAKLAGLQSPRGWGLFLIQKLVDEMNVRNDDARHTVELIMNLQA